MRVLAWLRNPGYGGHLHGCGSLSGRPYLVEKVGKEGSQDCAEGFIKNSRENSRETVWPRSFLQLKVRDVGEHLRQCDRRTQFLSLREGKPRERDSVEQLGLASISRQSALYEDE